MMKHQSALNIDEEISGNQPKGEEPPSKIAEQQLKSLEEDHSSLMKKYEQISKNKNEGLQLSQSKQDNNINNNKSQYEQQKRQHTPNKAKYISAELYSSAQQIISNEYMQQTPKEDRILHQLVENYKITNRDLSQKLDQERQEVLDQRVQIHSLETEIKFSKKENQRLTSMVESFSSKKNGNNNQFGQNIQGSVPGNVLYSGASFGDIYTSQMDSSNKSNSSDNNLIGNDLYKRQLENKIAIVEDQNVILNQEKQTLLLQNRILEEKISSLTLEKDQWKSQSYNNQLLKEVKQKRSEEQANDDVDVIFLKDTIAQLKKEQQDTIHLFQSKINQKNAELEKLLFTNKLLEDQLVEIQINLKSKDQMILKLQSEEKSLIERDLVRIPENQMISKLQDQEKSTTGREKISVTQDSFKILEKERLATELDNQGIVENERLIAELINYKKETKQLNDQMIQLKSDCSQLQKEIQLLNQEKETLLVQTKGQFDTIQMLNQQIAILEKISNETATIIPKKKQVEDKSSIESSIKKEIEDFRNKFNIQEKQIEQLKITNQALQKQIAIVEYDKQSERKLKKQESEEVNLMEERLNGKQQQAQQQEKAVLKQVEEIVEDKSIKRQEQDKQKQQVMSLEDQQGIDQLQQEVSKCICEIDKLQQMNTVYQLQIQNLQTQLNDKKNELQSKILSSNNQLNEMKFLEERLANLQKQNDLYNQKIFSLESRQQSTSLPPKDSASKRSSALLLLEEGISSQKYKQEGEDDKFQTLQKSYTQLNQQCLLQMKQIELLNQTIQELQKTIKKLASSQNNIKQIQQEKKQLEKNEQQQENVHSIQIPSTSDFQDYQETSKKVLVYDQNNQTNQNNQNQQIEQNQQQNDYTYQSEYNSRDELRDKNEKILIQDLDVQQIKNQSSNEIDRMQQVQFLQNENRQLLEKIMQVEQAFSQLSSKVEMITRQNEKQNLNPSTPVMSQNKIIFQKQLKSGEKPPQIPSQQLSSQKQSDKDLNQSNYNSVSNSKRQKIFEPLKRNISSDRRSSPNALVYLNNNIEINPSQTQYQSFANSPSRSHPDGFGHKRQNTLPSVFNSQQDFYIDSNSVNYNQRLKTQEFKRPNSFNTPHQIFNSEQKAKKLNQNEESVLLFSPMIMGEGRKKKNSEDETDDLMSNGSVDMKMKQMMYPHLNIYEYYDQVQNNGQISANVQQLKFERSMFQQYQMTIESLLRYKQGVFVQKIMYVETKEGLQIGCISQQQRDQDQIYLNLNLFYKNISHIPIDSLNVSLNGSNTCQAFAKPTVSNWSLSPNIQSKQELFFKFNHIPFGPIYADVTYQCQDIKKKFTMYLPVNIVKFLEQRTISAEKLLGKYLKIKANPKNTPKLQNGFIIKSEKFCLDRKFALNINDFQQFLPHFERIPSLDKLGEFMMGGNDFQLGGSYLLRENNLVFYMIFSIKTNKYATFEIFSEQNNPSNIKTCECILQNFIYLFIHPEQ